MSEWKAKRFWSEVACEAAENGFEIRLDARTVKTPAKAPLVVPTRAMAEAIATEWDAVETVINPEIMPVTRSANAAIDKVAVQHGEVAEMLAAYGDADLLCYRASAPQELVRLQAERWDPLLDWAEATFGVRLATREGVIHAPQEASTLAPLTARVHGFASFELAAFHDLVSLSGSLILGFAAAEGPHEVDALWDLSRLDEAWQEAQWGRDDEAHEMAEIKRAAFLHAKRFFDMARDIS